MSRRSPAPRLYAPGCSLSMRTRVTDPVDLRLIAYLNEGVAQGRDPGDLLRDLYRRAFEAEDLTRILQGVLQNTLPPMLDHYLSRALITRVPEPVVSASDGPVDWDVDAVLASVRKDGKDEDF